MCVGRTIAICCRSILVLLLFTGMIMSIVSVSSCDFMKAVYEVPTNFLGGNSTKTVSMDAALGLWRYETTEGCKAYSDYNNAGDSLFQNERQEIVAQKSGVAAPVLAFVTLLLLLLELCCCGRGKCGGSGIPCLKFLLALLLTATEICQGLTFLFMNSHQFCHGDSATSLLKHHCEISRGGSLSVGALVLFVMCSALLSCTPSLTSPAASDKELDTAATTTKTSPTTTAKSSDDFDDVAFGDDDDEPSKSKMQGTMA